MTKLFKTGLNINKLSPTIIEIQNYQHTLSSLLPDCFPGCEKTRAAAAIVLGFLAAVFVAAAAVGIAYTFGAIILLEGTLIFLGILAIEGIILIWRNLSNVENQQEKEAQAILDLPNVSIDVSQMSPEQFLKHAVSTKLLSPDASAQYSLLSNCQNMQEASQIFLAERHGNREDYIVNSRVATLLSKEGDTFLNEAGRTRDLAHVFTGKLAADIQFECWDSKPKTINHNHINVKLGLIFQKLIEILRAEDFTKQIDANLEEIDQELIELCNWINSEENHAIIADLKYLHEITQGFRKVKKYINNFDRIIHLTHQAMLLSDFSIHEVLAWAKTNQNHRQEALVSALNNNASKNRIFLSAGRDHILQNGIEVETRLHKYLCEKNKKYFIIYSKNWVQKKIVESAKTIITQVNPVPVAQNLEQATAITPVDPIKLPFEFNDFRQIPNIVSSFAIRKLLNSKKSECVRLIQQQRAKL